MPNSGISSVSHFLLRFVIAKSGSVVGEDPHYEMVDRSGESDGTEQVDSPTVTVSGHLFC